MSLFSYPPARKGDDVSDLHGRTVPDPYRWLEDPDAPEVVDWVRQQQKLTGTYFETVRETRDRVFARLEQLQNYPRASCPTLRPGVALQSRNTGLQNQDVLFKASSLDALAASETPLLDLNAIDPSGTTSLSSASLSDDGKYYAYGVSRGGSDWQELRVRDVASGADLPDTIQWAKFTGMAWLKDGSGFFYSRYPTPDIDASKAGTETASTQYCMVCLHVLGTPAAEDLLIWAEPAEPHWIISAELTDDGEYLVLSTAKGTDPVNRLTVAHLPTVLQPWRTSVALSVASALADHSGKPPPPSVGCYLPAVPFVGSFDAQFEYIANDGPRCVRGFSCLCGVW
jgi:prolyl oligopeptidase